MISFVLWLTLCLCKLSNNWYLLWMLLDVYFYHVWIWIHHDDILIRKKHSLKTKETKWKSKTIKKSKENDQNAKVKVKVKEKMSQDESRWVKRVRRDKKYHLTHCIKCFIILITSNLISIQFNWFSVWNGHSQSYLFIWYSNGMTLH